MLKIALTGNIASGKTTVLEFFKKDGAKTLCLDEVCHNLYEKESIKNLLKLEFKTCDRKKIAQVVFLDKKKLKKLEDILQPEILKIMLAFLIDNEAENYVIVAAPMLFEAGFQQYFNKIVFVSSKPQIRLKRLIKRNNLAKDEAIKRIDSQDIEEEKIKKSDIIIYNNDDIENLKKQYIEAKAKLNIL